MADDWPHATIMQAALDLGMLTGDYSIFDQALPWLAKYKEINLYTAYAPPLNPPLGQPRWYDDNGVIGLMLMQAFQQRPGGQQYLNLGLEIWPFLESGQASEGGQRW